MLDELAALLRALPPSRAVRKETRRMEQQAGLGGAALVRIHAQSSVARADSRPLKTRQFFVYRCALRVQGANGRWVGADGSDPLDRMLAALTPAVQQLAHIVCPMPSIVCLHTFMHSTNATDLLPQASKACETTTVQARRRDQGGPSGATGGGKQFYLGQMIAAVRTSSFLPFQ